MSQRTNRIFTVQCQLVNGTVFDLRPCIVIQWQTIALFMYIYLCWHLGCATNCINCDVDGCKVCGADYELENGVCSKSCVLLGHEALSSSHPVFLIFFFFLI